MKTIGQKKRFAIEADIIKHLRGVFTVTAIVMGLTVPIRAVSAQGLPPGQLPTLTGEWWQWAMSIPISVNPLLDSTGERCMIGQRGSVWFLGGVNGGGSAERTCSVPEGLPLFFPVINAINANSPNVCGQGPNNFSVKDLRAALKPFIDGAQNLSVTVDGQDVKKTLLRRVQSDPFEVVLPEDNLFVAPCAGDSPAGVYSPAVDDGYYVALPPLRTGSHTIHFHADNANGSVAQDVVYHLTVAPVSLK
jgi:hypothetical protein